MNPQIGDRVVILKPRKYAGKKATVVRLKPYGNDDFCWVQIDDGPNNYLIFTTGARPLDVLESIVDALPSPTNR